MSVLIVGEAPNASGQVFYRSSGSYFRGRVPPLAATNLFHEWPGADGKGSAFPIQEARERVRKLERRNPKRVAFVLLGKRLGRAFGLDGKYRPGYLQWQEVRGRMVCVFPHPSGINQWWNDPANVAAAEAFWKEIA